jgi:hypothetical protein
MPSHETGTRKFGQYTNWTWLDHSCEQGVVLYRSQRPWGFTVSKFCF